MDDIKTKTKRYHRIPAYLCEDAGWYDPPGEPFIQTDRLKTASMKTVIRSVFALVVIFTATAAMAQPTSEAKRDRAYDRDLLPQREVIPYDHIREADVFWEKGFGASWTFAKDEPAIYLAGRSFHGFHLQGYHERRADCLQPFV